MSHVQPHSLHKQFMEGGTTIVPNGTVFSELITVLQNISKEKTSKWQNIWVNDIRQNITINPILKNNNKNKQKKKTDKQKN